MAALFLYLGITKIDANWIQSPEKLVASLNNYHQKATGIHQTYLETIAIPYANLWSKLMAIGETAIGISLLLGLLLRLSCIVGIIMVLNFHAANGNLYSLTFIGSPWAALIIAGFLILFLAYAGRWKGVDGLLAKSRPHGILW